MLFVINIWGQRHPNNDNRNKNHMHRNGQQLTLQGISSNPDANLIICITTSPSHQSVISVIIILTTSSLNPEDHGTHLCYACVDHGGPAQLGESCAIAVKKPCNS